MKAKMLKIAGVKSEAAFYKKFPNQEAFMKVHGKEFKKAQVGMTLDKNNNGVLDNLEPINMNAIGQTQNWSDTQGYKTPIQDQRQYQGQYENAIQRPQLTPVSSITPRGSTNPLATGNVNGKSAFDISTLGEQNPIKKGDGGMGAMNLFTGLVNAGKAIKAAEAETKHLQTWANVSDVKKRADISNAFAEKPKNQWFSPDDPRFIQNASELYNTQGGPTDVITQNGGRLQGGGEIQNTYAPNTLYDDLGYEPLDESDDDVKAYQNGGMWSQFPDRFGNFAGGGDSSDGDAKSFLGGSALGKGGLFGGDTGGGSWLAGAMGGNSSWANAASMIPGPLGMGLTMAAQMFDPNPGKQRTARNTMSSNNAFASNLDAAGQFHNQFSQVTQNGGDLQPYEDGGWVSNDWQPQVIASFGGLDEQEVYDYAHEGMDTLRAGGHMRDYTPVSDQGMETYAMGGQLKTHGVGEIETIGYNPYMPGSGEMGILRGPSHKNGGIDISYGNAQNDYTTAQNGSGDPDVNAEGGETIIEMKEGGEVNPQTSAVILGNIPFNLNAVKATKDEDLIKLGEKYDGKTIKSIGNSLAKDNQKSAKYKSIASKLGNKSDNTPSGMLETATGKIINDAAEMRYKQNAKEQMKLSNWQSAVNDAKDDYSSLIGKNISAEDMGKGLIRIDKDPVTKDAPLKNAVAKFGSNLMKAQNSVQPLSANNSEEPSITEEQYNNFVKLYEEGKNTKSKKSPSIKNFQHLYHQSFPKEALAAIQKTTRENGLSNKAKAMGLTVEDITSGKDVNKILESNEDEFFGPRTEQYMASISSKFKKTPELGLTPLGTKTTPTTVAADKKDIGVVPLKPNKFGQYADMLRQFLPSAKLPGIDPRQFAGEYMAMAQNQYEPIPMQQVSTQLDPMTRVSYQDIRNQNTADFRDAERNMAYNPAAISGLLGKKYLANQQGYGEEFRTNQGLEQQIYGGNRDKVNQAQLMKMQLNADQAAKQAIAASKTKEINQKAIASIADKYMQHDARNLEYNVKSNLFPTFAYDQSGRIRTQGPGYQPVIPQIYGGKGTVEQVPIYGADGKITGYQMQEYDPNAEQAVAQNGGSTNKKNKGSVVKNAKNGSIVKLQKNF